MTNYEEFFLNTPTTVVELELFQISHSNFSGTLSFVRNAFGGVTVTLEDGKEQEFIYFPARIVPLSASEYLEQAISISLGDLGEELPKELDLIDAGDGWGEKPAVTYRTYRSDDLTQPLFGPIYLETSNVAFDKLNVTIDARAKELNLLATGATYTYEDFPGLAGYL